MFILWGQSATACRRQVFGHFRAGRVNMDQLHGEYVRGTAPDRPLMRPLSAPVVSSRLLLGHQWMLYTSSQLNSIPRGLFTVNTFAWINPPGGQDTGPGLCRFTNSAWSAQSLNWRWMWCFQTKQLFNICRMHIVNVFTQLEMVVIIVDLSSTRMKEIKIHRYSLKRRL